MEQTLPFAPDQPWLAPLAGFSDLPFRLLCRAHGAAVACTEMVSAKGLVYNSKGTDELLRTIAADGPLVVQLFGSEPDIMRRAMERLVPNFQWFDLNMGCSVPKVVKTGCGAAMLRDTENALRVAKVMLEVAGPGKTGFKLRLGYEKTDRCFLDLAKALEDMGAGWITLHPRTARDGFSGVADWDALGELVSALSIPVVASGDLFTAANAVECVKRTGVSSVMFARGALNNPAIFGELRALLRGGPLHPPCVGDLLALIRAHMRLAREFSSEHAALLKMRTFVPRYVRHLPGARHVRQRLTQCRSWSELDETLEFFAACPQENILPDDKRIDNHD